MSETRVSVFAKVHLENELPSFHQVKEGETVGEFITRTTQGKGDIQEIYATETTVTAPGCSQRQRDCRTRANPEMPALVLVQEFGCKVIYVGQKKAENTVKESASEPPSAFKTLMSMQRSYTLMPDKK